MTAESPFPPMELAAPWLAGHGLALLLVGLVAVWVASRADGERRARRMGAVGWGFAATVMPVAWLVARWLPGWVGEWTADEAIRQSAAAAGVAVVAHGVAAFLALYLSDLGDATARERPQPTSPPAPVSRPPSKPAASPKARPTLAPPKGTLAARSGAAPQADGLLRVLSDGTDMQRAAAARALALSFGGSASEPVVRGLLDVLADDDADDESRVEAWVATCRVMGDPLPWELEAALRRDGPGSIDPAQVLAWEDRLNGG